MPTALAGNDGSKAYDANDGVVGMKKNSAGTMAQHHQPMVPLALRVHLDNQGQEKVTPRKLFNEESGGAGSENS
ncbi:hypothetical protein Tco_1464830 [Tanacetum coccineum]